MDAGFVFHIAPLEFYAIILEKILDVIFLSAWILVSVIGSIASYKEFRNNQTFSIVNEGLSIITFVIGILTYFYLGFNLSKYYKFDTISKE